MEQINLTEHQLNRLENLRMQRMQMDEQIKLLITDIVDAKGKTIKPNGKIEYQNGVLLVETIAHAKVIKDKLKKGK